MSNCGYEDINHCINGFDQLSAEQQQEMVASIWPYQVNKNKIFTLRLSKCIKYQLNNVQIELRKRGI